MTEKDLLIQEQRAEIKRLSTLLTAAMTFVPHECAFCSHETTSGFSLPCSAFTLDNDCFEWNGECCPNDV